jgi:hypothetical protein
MAALHQQPAQLILAGHDSRRHDLPDYIVPLYFHFILNVKAKGRSGNCRRAANA